MHPGQPKLPQSFLFKKPFSSMAISNKRIKYHRYSTESCSSASEEDINIIPTEDTCLLPGLPNHLAHLCLSSLRPSLLYSVCHSWRRLIYSPSFPPFFSLYTLLSPLTKNLANNCVEIFSLDPISSLWRPLPSPPEEHHPLQLLHNHPSFLSRKLPIQSVKVSGNLVLLAATTQHLTPAFSCPLVFNPQSNKWLLGPQFTVPRRWCATGSVTGAVYVGSGVGSQYQEDVAKSVEQWDVVNKSSEEWTWEKRAQLKNHRFSREAVEAVGYKGKLCMVNVKGNGPKEGAIFDTVNDRWEDMPEGMLAGWNGPAATMAEDTLYVVDDFKGTLSIYNAERDSWDKVIESFELKGALQIDAGGGRVCVVCGNGKKIAVVDVTVLPPKIFVVEPPLGLEGYEIVAVHVLPRTTLHSEFF